MRTKLAAALTAALLFPASAGAQQGPPGGDEPRDYTGGPPPMERQRRYQAPEPIARKDFDRAVEKLFRAGDTNRDGQITLAELNAAIDARKARIVAERFAAIDRDRNQSISMAEFTAWQNALGAAALDEGVSGGQPLGELVAEEVRIGFGDDGEGDMLGRMIDPLNSVVLVNANTDYDGGASLAELLAYEGRKFDALDANRDGWLTSDETQKLMPPEGAPGGPPPR
jgi:hypothetical protein